MIPSQRKLEEAFPGKGKVLRDLLAGHTDPQSYASVKKWVDACFNEPRKQEQVECAVNEVTEGYGTEAIWGESHTRPVAVYVNQGDTYTETLLYDYRTQNWRITSWGDWVESQERQGRPCR